MLLIYMYTYIMRAAGTPFQTNFYVQKKNSNFKLKKKSF